MALRKFSRNYRVNTRIRSLLQPARHSAAHRLHDTTASLPKEGPGFGPACVVLNHPYTGNKLTTREYAERFSIQSKRVSVVAISDQCLGLSLSHLEIKQLQVVWMKSDDMHARIVRHTESEVDTCGKNATTVEGRGLSFSKQT